MSKPVKTPPKVYTIEERMKPIKWIKHKDTGVVTCVSQAYFETYEMDGWFIEVANPKPVKKAVAPKKE